MKLTPQDILTQEFDRCFRGYNPEEVKSFLIQTAEALENETQAKEEIRRELKRIRENLNRLEKREQVLRDTLVSAQKFSREIENNSKKEAELIVKEAEIRSEQIVNDAVTRQKSIKEEIRGLKFKRREIEDDLVNMLNSLKELIESYRQQDEEFDKVEYLGK